MKPKLQSARGVLGLHRVYNTPTVCLQKNPSHIGPQEKNKRQPEVKPAVQPEVPQTKAAVGKGRKEQKIKPTKAAVGKGKSPGVQPEVKPSVQPEVPQTKAAVGKGSPWTSPGVQHTDCLLAKAPEVVQPEVPQTKAAVGKGSPWTSPGVQHTDCLLAKAPEVVQPEVHVPQTKAAVGKGRKEQKRKPTKAAVGKGKSKAPEVVQPEVQQNMRDTSAEHSFNVSTLFHDTSTVEEHSLADASLSNNVVEDGPTTFEIVPGGTAKGKDMLLDSLGYSYNVRVVRNKTRNWCCSVRNKRIRCPATVIEKNNMFKRGVHDHAHQADPGKKHTVKLTRKVKDEAVSNVYQPAKKIVEDKMMNELRDDDFALPDPDLLKRKANRYRQKTRPAEPRGMDFKVAEDFIPEGFLRHDITVDGARHIIFATDTQLDILRRAKTWYVDGTFKCLRAKDPFMQLFSIHAFIKKDGIMKQVPLAFAFMSRRRKKDYKKVLKKVKSTFDSPPSVERVVMDFEAAVWSAFRKVFPLVSLHGCAFHWSQAVFRKVQALGLSGEYTEKGPCHEFIRQVLALPLLPAEHIRPAFSKLTSRSTAQLMPLMGSVDTTWISGPWKVEEWSVFGQSIRTNNDCEGWHRRLNYRCVGPPPFYLLVRSLHEEARLLPIQVKLITERKLSKDQRKKSRSIQALVFAVWGSYSAGEISTSRLLKRLAAVYAPSS